MPGKNPFSGAKTGGEYGANSDSGILDLSEGNIDFSCQGYKGQPGLMGKRGDDPIEVDPGSQSYPAPLAGGKPDGTPANPK